MTRQITIGTRASPLALAQTEQIVTALQGAVGLPAGAISVQNFHQGDEILDRTLAEIGGKGCSRMSLMRACATARLTLPYTA